MFCKYCGRQINAHAKFCPVCGRQSTAPAQTTVPVYTCAPVQKPVNGLGIAAFVLGIVSLFFGFYLLIVAIAGVVLGGIAVARRKKYRLGGLAIAGLAISCVSCAFWLVIFMITLYYATMGIILLLFFPFLFA